MYIEIVFLIIGTVPLFKALLLYPPQSTSFGITSSVSVPITEYLPDRRILIDWCFQMSYNLPPNVSSFYNIPIWPGKYSSKISKRETEPEDYALAETQQHFAEAFEKYDTNLEGNRHPSDFSAGELYQGVEDFLVSYGFHETCLLRSVCELARHPFDDQHQNILTDVVTFFLTPSLHAGFADSEQLYRDTYASAELRGFFGEDCALLFQDCERDLMGVITKVMFPNG